MLDTYIAIAIMVRMLGFILTSLQIVFRAACWCGAAYKNGLAVWTLVQSAFAVLIDIPYECHEWLHGAHARVGGAHTHIRIVGIECGAHGTFPFRFHHKFVSTMQLPTVSLLRALNCISLIQHSEHTAHRTLTILGSALHRRHVQQNEAQYSAAGHGSTSGSVILHPSPPCLEQRSPRMRD